MLTRLRQWAASQRPTPTVTGRRCSLGPNGMHGSFPPRVPWLAAQRIVPSPPPAEARRMFASSLPLSSSSSAASPSSPTHRIYLFRACGPVAQAMRLRQWNISSCSDDDAARQLFFAASTAAGPQTQGKAAASSQPQPHQQSSTARDATPLPGDDATLRREPSWWLLTLPVGSAAVYTSDGRRKTIRRFQTEMRTYAAVQMCNCHATAQEPRSCAAAHVVRLLS